MATPTLSIIAPVYNVARYLPSFLASIRQQTFQDWELILVNDESTDNSLDILMQYAQQDSRMRVVNKHNGGVSSAPNAGLEHARGEYITFIDPDDLMPSWGLEALYDAMKAHDVDIVIGRRYGTSDFAPDNVPRKANSSLWPKEPCIFSDLPPALFLGDQHLVVTASQLFKKQLWQNMRFHEDLILFEDHVTIKEVIFTSKRLLFIDDYVYIYRKRLGSATNSRRMAAFDVFSGLEKLESVIKKYGIIALQGPVFRLHAFQIMKIHMMRFAPLRRWLSFARHIQAIMNAWSSSSGEKVHWKIYHTSWFLGLVQTIMEDFFSDLPRKIALFLFPEKFCRDCYHFFKTLRS